MEGQKVQTFTVPGQGAAAEGQPAASATSFRRPVQTEQGQREITDYLSMGPLKPREVGLDNLRFNRPTHAQLEQAGNMIATASTALVVNVYDYEKGEPIERLIPIRGIKVYRSKIEGEKNPYVRVDALGGQPYVGLTSEQMGVIARAALATEKKWAEEDAEAKEVAF